ncbi:MAG: hypothetical protein SVV03_00360 [Candidatus Nanohaloarchaea archaeon]|nr:hypothetical protein [Candidatus Nanohaloarchaea archaeon]
MEGKIGIDMDNVIARSIDTLLSFYNEKYGTDVKSSDLDDMKLHKFLGITKKKLEERLDDFYINYDHITRVPPVDGAKKALDRMVEEGLDLEIVTARPLKREEKTRKWIQKHFPDHFSNLHFVGGRDKTKAEVCKEQGLEVFVDDVKEFAVRCAEAGVETLLFSTPWNRNLDCSKHERVKRVESWEDVLEEVLN